MFGQMIEETPFDLRWRMFGIPCRVHPLFWLMSAVICFYLVELGLVVVLIGMLLILISILLHELGHVVAGRIFGSDGHIVLWAMGGLAIGSADSPKRWQRIVVSLAGPFSQMLIFWLPLWLFGDKIPVPEDFKLARRVYALIDLFWFVNLYWPILNLLPIYPLDGGQVTREICTGLSRDNGIRVSLQISIGVSALLALHAFLAHARDGGITYLPAGITSGIFFAMFAAMSVQLYQIELQRDRWTDDRWN